MKPNWFIGLYCDETGWLQSSVQHLPPRVRAFQRSDLHVTLAFLGACSEAAALQAWKQATQHPPAALYMTTSALQPMGKKSRPSAFSLLFDDDEPLVVWMQTHRAAVLAAAAARPDNRTPLPHLTIARPQRRISQSQRDKALIWCQSQKIQPQQLWFRHMALYTWSMDRKIQLFRKVHIMQLPVSY